MISGCLVSRVAGDTPECVFGHIWSHYYEGLTVMLALALRRTNEETHEACFDGTEYVINAQKTFIMATVLTPIQEQRIHA